jgi:hypothetical protein
MHSDLLKDHPFATHQSATMPNKTMTVFGPPLSPSATYAERQAYRRDVLHLPGPVDRWLLTNIRSPRIDFLQDYLMLVDVKNQYVACIAEIESMTVRLLAPALQLFRGYGSHVLPSFRTRIIF